MSYPSVPEETINSLGISSEEFEMLNAILVRELNYNELRVFSLKKYNKVSYENSLYWKKILPELGDKISINPNEVVAENSIKFITDGQEEVVVSSSFVLDSEENNYIYDEYQNENAEIDINIIPEPENLKKVAFKLLKHVSFPFKKIKNEKESSVKIFSDNSEFFTIENDESGNRFIVMSQSISEPITEEPEKRANILVSKLLRKIICSNADPLLICKLRKADISNPTNNLKYYKEFINGIANVSNEHNIPICLGNVVLDKLIVSEDSKISPKIGMLGLLGNYKPLITPSFKKYGDLIFLIGNTYNDISNSEYLKCWHKINKSALPKFDFDNDIELFEALKESYSAGMVNSACVVDKGGIFFALAESCYENNLGFDIETTDSLRDDVFLFGESQGRVLLSISSPNASAFMKLMTRFNIESIYLGTVTEGQFYFNEKFFGSIEEVKQVIS